jgi:hypothetical protein
MEDMLVKLPSSHSSSYYSSPSSAMLTSAFESALSCEYEVAYRMNDPLSLNPSAASDFKEESLCSIISDKYDYKKNSLISLFIRASLSVEEGGVAYSSREEMRNIGGVGTSHVIDALLLVVEKCCFAQDINRGDRRSDFRKLRCGDSIINLAKSALIVITEMLSTNMDPSRELQDITRRFVNVFCIWGAFQGN